MNKRLLGIICGFSALLILLLVGAACNNVNEENSVIISDGLALTKSITTIATEDFESGNLSGGTGWSGNWTATGAAGILSESPQAGTYHARLSNDSTFNRGIDLTNYTNVHMTLYWKTSEYTAGDKAYIKIYNPGLTVLMSINKNSDSQEYVSADLSLLSGSYATISFEQVVNADTDYFYIDSIVITGESSVEPTPTDTPEPTSSGLESPSPSISTSPSPTPTTPPVINSKIFGYYASWSIYNARQYYPIDVPITKITHLMYAFANIDWNETTGLGDMVIGDEFADLNKRFDDYPGTNGMSLYGCFQTFRHLRDYYNPGMKFLISVGGWSWSTYFSNLAQTQESRSHFAQSCASFVSTYQFDGIDVNWEFPTSASGDGTIFRPEDKHNFTLLMQEVKSALEAQGAIDGKDYEITISTAGYKKRIDEIEPTALADLVDYILVMSYEYRNQQMEVTGHNGQLYANPADTINNDSPIFLKTQANVDHGIQTYLVDYNVPPSKLVMGIPFFGRGYSRTDNANNGLFQPFGRIPRGSWDNTGVFSYPDVMSKSGNIYWDNVSKASYFFDGSLFISFESTDAIAAKAAYVHDYNLAGMMFWDFASDASNELAGAIYDDLSMY